MDLIKELKNLFSNTMIALDIGNSAVKLLEVKETKAGLMLLNYAIQPIPDGAVVDNDIKNQAAIVENLNIALERLQPKSTRTLCIIPDTLVVARNIRVGSELTDSEIMDEIELEADRYIPYPIEDVNLDFAIPATKPRADLDGMLDIRLIAARTDYVEARVDIMTACHLAPTVLELESNALSYALRKIVEYLPNRGQHEIITHIDIGHMNCNVAVYNNNEVIYHRNHHFGMKQLIQEITEYYNINTQEAMTAVRLDLLPEGYYENILPSFKENLVQQISRFLQLFFSSEQGTEKIDYMVLTGGGSGLVDIDLELRKQLAQKVYKGNPFNGFLFAPTIDPLDFQRYSADLVACSGLALRGL